MCGSASSRRAVAAEACAPIRHRRIPMRYDPSGRRSRKPPPVSSPTSRCPVASGRPARRHTSVSVSRTPPGANASRIAITLPATLGGLSTLAIPASPTGRPHYCGAPPPQRTGAPSNRSVVADVQRLHDQVQLPVLRLQLLVLRVEALVDPREALVDLREALVDLRE